MKKQATEKEKIFAPHITYKGLLQISHKRIESTIEKRARDLHGLVIEEIQMSNKHTKGQRGALGEDTYVHYLDCASGSTDV